jgi:RimJ/RimL family protein N-acetyltransferase
MNRIRGSDAGRSLVSEVRTVSPLTAAHAEGLRALSMEYDFAAAAAMNVGLSAVEAAEYIDAAEKAREEGRSYIFVLTDRDEVLGLCRLIGVLGVPRLIVAIGGAYRGRGNGSFLVKHVLEFAFEKLRLDRVTASGPCLNLVSQFGSLSTIHAIGGINRREWQAARARTVK